MINLKDIHSLTDFQRNTKQFVQHAKETHNPIVLTVKGRAELVVLNAEVYQKLMERLEYAESVAAIRQGIQEFEQGKGQPARDALAALRVRHGISG